MLTLFPFVSHSQTRDGLVVEGQELVLTLKTESVHFDKVLVRHEPDNEESLISMIPAGKEGRLKRWTARIPVNDDQPVTHYVFKLVTGQIQWWLDARGVQQYMPGREFHFKHNAEHQPPEWVSEQVFYQIFPERFCNGNPEISVRTGEYKLSAGRRETVAKQWGEEVGGYPGTGSTEFFGGDLAGISNQLDYLQDLGITSLYLNPIFRSPSNHKYDTADYFTVDPHFGTNEEFAELSANIHSRNMKIVLDAVVNHTSTQHQWFDIADTSGKGAYHHPDSAYRDYYFFNGDKDYIGWKGVSSLPVLNFRNEQVRDHIYRGENSVLRYWLKEPYCIDGWRFDVIHMLGDGKGARNNADYVRAFRQAVKDESAQAYVLGEHFSEASQWLQGEQEDGAMNYYGFAHPARALFAGIDISHDPITLSVPEFTRWLLEARAKVPWQNQLAQLNQLDSHDTHRFLTLVGSDRARMEMASVLLFAYVGTPCLYYGTEVGMEGGQDPDNRRCFPWDTVSSSGWLPFYKQLISIRKQHPELQKGGFELLNCSEDTLVFGRKLGSGISLMAMSFSDQDVAVPVWKLGIEAGRVTSQLTEQGSIAFENGYLNLALAANRADILALNNTGE
ncbi:maltodextrin glucosidase [Vibrio albus]|uniref:Maltodextrin glucosidase n=2 Tax=Vibrio albus TaxID=2200953 RepID=A0A2U3BF39_9VIBR|nr:maltodextrin glucosidase [Vibrio albus]